MSQKQYKPHYEHLKNKWLDEQKELQKNLVERHKEAFLWLEHRTKQLMVGSAGSLLMLVTPVTTAFAAQQVPPKQISPTPQTTLDPQVRLIIDLSYSLPENVQLLTDGQEKVVSKTLTRYFGIPVSPLLQGKRLDRTYGLIGAEQHLMRYPGDTMATHFSPNDDAEKYYSSGMAPGRGAWGYFANSQQEMTEKDIMREKYYIAVQTFLASGYNEHTKEYSDFFKYRKMLVVNPENGKALVADIADAGPSPWTGKHLGGS